MKDALPSTFGRYRVTRPLGEGAMGSVFVACDEVLGREVAVKAIRPAVLKFGGSDRFMNEARAVAQLGHPNVVRVFDVGTQDGVPYLVMEMAHGGSLKERLGRGERMRPDEVRTLGIQVAHALAAAHTRSIVHRDVKPANILEAQRGTWKLADFGVAHVPDVSLTITGQFLGSPAYAAPESLRCGVFSPASDVYSLGCTLYEAVVGRGLHNDSGHATRLKHHDSADAYCGELLAVAPSIADAITRCLAPSPELRPSAADLASLLATGSPIAAAPLAVAPPPGSRPEHTVFVADSVVGPAPTRSHRRLAMICGAVLLAIGLIAAAGSRSERSNASAGTADATVVPMPAAVQPASFGNPSLHVERAAYEAIPTESEPRRTRKRTKHRKHRDHDD